MALKRNINTKKASGVLINRKFNKQLPEDVVIVITYIFNAILRSDHFSN